MTPALLLPLITGVLGGVGLFLIGMKFLSEGMQNLAGPKLSRVINGITGNRYTAILVGILVAFLFQSSSAATVMVVGFVNSGIMTLFQALSVSLGAQVGTTLSLWVLTLNITKYGLLVVGAASFPYLFAKRPRFNTLGRVLLGFGLLFYGMQLMSGGFAPLREDPEIMRALSTFDATTTFGFVAAVLVSTLVTGIIQSSAAMIVMVMGMGVNGLINFPTAVAIIVGAEIGTTVTALLSCIGANRNSLRSALGNTLLVVLRAVVVSCFHTFFVRFFRDAALVFLPANTAMTDPRFLQLAIPCTHTISSVVGAVMIAPFLLTLEKLLYVVVPKSKSEQRTSTRHHTQFLDKRLMRTPPIALIQSAKEIQLMGQVCGTMLDTLRVVVADPKHDTAIEQEIFDAEADLDIAQKEITEYVSTVLRSSGGIRLSGVEVTIRSQLRCADEFESVSDYVQSALKAFLKIRDAGETLSEAATEEVLSLIDAVQSFRLLTLEILDKRRPTFDELATAHSATRRIDNLAKEYRHRHMDRIGTACNSPVKGVIYNDLLVSFRRMNDHLINVVETTEGK